SRVAAVCVTTRLVAESRSDFPESDSDRRRTSSRAGKRAGRLARSPAQCRRAASFRGLDAGRSRRASWPDSGRRRWFDQAGDAIVAAILSSGVTDMSTSNFGDSTKDDRVNQIVADYLNSIGRGEVPDRAALL